ncbi:MAG: hypothetical protein LBI45_08640 [Bacteroidales bacterium]|jgi:hypothetical protein|nr:hypothetical protein [Bacteroidales bacterium]
MKIIKFLVSALLTLGVIVLVIWSVIKAKEQKCTDAFVTIRTQKEMQLLSKSDILNILKRNHVEWEGKTIKEIGLSNIHKVLADENYIKSVDKVHILGTKLQIEVTLYDVLLEINRANGDKFLLDANGIYLPYSPKVKNDVIIASGYIPNTFQNKERITFEHTELYEIFTVATLIHADPFYNALFRKMYVNEKLEIVLTPSVGDVPVLFGTMQDAEHKLKVLRRMYEDVMPYTPENKFAQLDVRYKNRIVATKTKS